MRSGRTTGFLMASILAGIIQVVIVSVFYAGGNVRGQTEVGRADVPEYGQQSSKKIRFFHDPKPQPDVPREARHAGTVPLERNQPKENKFNITFRAAQDHKNYGALRNVIHGPITAIRIRYFDSEAFDRARAESFLKTVIESERGDTYTHIFWAEPLGVPVIEGYLYSEDFYPALPGYLLVWPGRAVYRDPHGKWWFTSMPLMGGKK